MSKENQRDVIVNRLKSKGLRVTPQRFAVYANLCSRRDHPTVEQILKDLNQDFPISSQATVYTSLQALRKVGLVKEVLLEEGVSRYDANVEPHHHFHCRQCGSIKDVPWDTFDSFNLEHLPYLAESYEVTIRGLCDRCTGNN